MKSIFYSIVFVLVLGIMSSCKKPNPDIEALVSIVTTINETPNRVLKNGNTLNNCEFMAGDTVITYNITVPDKRYDGLTTDSIKTLIKSGLDPKLVKIVSRNSIGIKYNLKMLDKETVIVIPSSELK